MKFQPPLKSIMLEDVINYAKSHFVILKIDIEGYECNALQPNVLLNKLGKFLPYIFMEWGHVTKNTYRNCPESEYINMLKLFYDGGYLPFNPGEKKKTLFGSVKEPKE